MTDNPGTMSWDYTYDALHRLVYGDHILPGNVTDEESYSYDAVGNRTERIVTLHRYTVTDTLSYGAASNRLETVSLFTPRVGPTPPSTVVRTLGYGDSGNTASDDDGAGTVLTHNYDATDRLAEIKQGAATVAAYLHNTGGQRVAKTVGVVTTHYIYDLGGNLVAEADGGSGATTAEYVWLGSLPLAFVTGGAVYRTHADHLGTPVKLTDATGAVVWTGNSRPFGEPDTGAGGALTFNLRFPGQYFDEETGLHYNYFRDYDNTLGRYMQSDPIGLAGGWNTYAYVGGNPVMLVDPDGLFVVFNYPGGNSVVCKISNDDPPPCYSYNDLSDEQKKKIPPSVLAFIKKPCFGSCCIGVDFKSRGTRVEYGGICLECKLN